MALAFVPASQNAGSVADGGTLAYSANVGATTLLVACIVVPGVGVQGNALSDTLGNTWALAERKVGTAAGAGNAFTAEIWYAANATAGACTVTFDWTGTANGQVVLAEFSGFVDGVTLDDSASAETDNTTPNSHGSITTTENEEVLVSCMAFSSAFTVSSRLSDWNALTAGSRRDSQYKIASSTETTTGAITCGTAEDSTGCIASFFTTATVGGAETQTRVPTGDSATSDTWTPSTGSDSYAVVDEGVSTANDADYVSKADADGAQQFTFTAFNIAASAIAKVSVTFRAWQLIGAGSLAARVRIGGTDYTYGTPQVVNTGAFTTYTQDFTENPATTDPWEEAEVEAIQEFGFVSSGLTAGEAVAVSAAEITVHYTDGGGGGGGTRPPGSLLRLGIG